MSIATSLNFGIMVSMVFLLHQNWRAWDANKVKISNQKTNFYMNLIYLGSSVFSLITVRMIISFLARKTWKFGLVIASQMVGILGLCAVIWGLYVQVNPCVIFGLGAYSIFTFPSFSISLQAIGKRTGKLTDLVATANIFTVGQIFAAAIFSINLSLKTLIRTDRNGLIAVVGALTFLAIVSCALLARGVSKLNEKFRMRRPAGR